MADKMGAIQGYGCISSVYISFKVLQHIAFRRMPSSIAGLSCLHKCFISKNITIQVPAFVVYNIPLVEYTSVAQSSCHVTAIHKLESVQRFGFTKRFAKRPHGMSDNSYRDRLDSLTLRQLGAQFDYVYKIHCDLVETDTNSLLIFTLVHPFATTIIVYIPQCFTLSLLFFSANRVINPWNALSSGINFSNLTLSSAF